jgi:single-strand selective monofunctional uracil DNA glycosylase
MSASIESRVVSAARALNRELAPLRFGPPITHVYDPARYASRPHTAYIRAFATSPKHVVFLGMNPGPFGMSQTGVPFGDVRIVREWLGIEGPVFRPRLEHPKRPVEGFACARSEVSGARLWGAVRDRFRSPDRFFARHYIANYCPLAFMEASGRNRTPDKLPAAERDPLFTACDRHLRRLVGVLEPRWVVGIGRFAEDRARAALEGIDVKIGRVMHPSPANPRAQRDWAGTVQRELQEQGVCRRRK